MLHVPFKQEIECCVPHAMIGISCGEWAVDKRKRKRRRGNAQKYKRMTASRRKEQQMVCVCLSLAGQLLGTGPWPRQTCFLFNSWQRRDNSSKTFQVQQMPLGLPWKGAEVWERVREREREREEEGYSGLAMCLSEVSTKEDQQIRKKQYPLWQGEDRAPDDWYQEV